MHDRSWEGVDLAPHVPFLQKRLLSAARRLPPHEAEDLVQDTLIELHKAMRAGVEIVDLTAFALRILHRRSIDRQRRKMREAERLRRLPSRLDGVLGIESAEREAERATLLRVIAKELERSGLGSVERLVLTAYQAEVDPVEFCRARGVRRDSVERAHRGIELRLFGAALRRREF
jgi:RNA polymerase sigma factor (sigma-70 family)